MPKKRSKKPSKAERRHQRMRDVLTKAQTERLHAMFDEFGPVLIDGRRVSNLLIVGGSIREKAK